ncbi:MAG: hemerythrin domain-containing protein [Ignavibacteriae bacterium]|nr:hemerythrin domain-containing protein [Ignavibacteriota bacterium]
MQLFTRDTRLADAIHSNYLLIPVINRFGVSLGFGDRTIREVCRAHRIDEKFFLVIINVFSHPHYFPEKTLLTFNPLVVLSYLQKTHAYYREIQIPVIERQLRQLIGRAGKEKGDLLVVRKFFQEYKRELLAHLNREERITFPYIRNVYRAHQTRRAARKPSNAHAYSMEAYESEHNNVDEKLWDLKNILIKYLPGTVDAVVRNAVICEIFRLEQDIRDHTRIEETILMPRVTALEHALRRVRR